MKPIYVPLLKAKKGEFDALHKLKDTKKDSIIPLLDIPKPSSTESIEAKLTKVAASIGICWAGRDMFLDMFNWPSDKKTESGEHVLFSMWKKLEAQNVLCHPIVGFDL